MRVSNGPVDASTGGRDESEATDPMFLSKKKERKKEKENYLIFEMGGS